MPPNNDELMDKLHIASLITEWFDGPILKDVDKRACEGLISAIRLRLNRAAPPPSGDAVRVAVEAFKLMQQAMSILNERRGSGDGFIKRWCEDGAPVVANALSALRALPADTDDYAQRFQALGWAAKAGATTPEHAAEIYEKYTKLLAADQPDEDAAKALDKVLADIDESASILNQRPAEYMMKATVAGILNRVARELRAALQQRVREG